MSNDNAEIRVDTRIVTDIKVRKDKPDIFVLDKKRKEILIVEENINQDLFTVVENEKLRKYDLLANGLRVIHQARTKIIPYVMTWDGVVADPEPTMPGEIMDPEEPESSEDSGLK